MLSQDAVELRQLGVGKLPIRRPGVRARLFGGFRAGNDGGHGWARGEPGKRQFEERGLSRASSAKNAWELLQKQAPRLRAVVTELRMPGGSDGLGLARRVHEAAPSTPVLLVTGHLYSGPLGANCSLLEEPFSPVELHAAVRQAVERGS